MSGSIRIKPDQMAAEIMKGLKEYQKLSEAAVVTAVDKTARDTAKSNRTKAPGKGRYRKSWTSQVTIKAFNGSYGRTVYSKLPGLPHLLEYGHEIKGYLEGRGRTRTREFPHIQQDDVTEKMFEENLKKELQKR